MLLIGGLAVIAHGLSRPTKDADVWLERFDSAEQCDLMLTKFDTGRDQDLADITFLEQQVRSSLGSQLETAAPAEARALLDRYADHAVLARALRNPHEEVRAMALALVREFAEGGDPFAIDILRERGEWK